MTCENCTNKECKCFNNNLKESPAMAAPKRKVVTPKVTKESFEESNVKTEDAAFAEALNIFLTEWKRTLKIEVPIAEIPELVQIALNAPRNETVLQNNSWLKVFKLPE